MLSKVIEWLKGTFTPTSNWTCTYWTMDDPERVTETFDSQELAHESELKRRTEGYITIVRFAGTSSDEGLFKGALQIIGGAISSHKSLAEQHGTDLADHVRGHLASGRKE